MWTCRTERRHGGGAVLLLNLHLFQPALVHIGLSCIILIITLSMAVACASYARCAASSGACRPPGRQAEVRHGTAAQWRASIIIKLK